MPTPTREICYKCGTPTLHPVAIPITIPSLGLNEAPCYICKPCLHSTSLKAIPAHSPIAGFDTYIEDGALSLVPTEWIGKTPLAVVALEIHQQHKAPRLRTIFRKQ